MSRDNCLIANLKSQFFLLKMQIYRILYSINVIRLHSLARSLIHKYDVIGSDQQEAKLKSAGGGGMGGASAGSSIPSRSRSLSLISISVSIFFSFS